MRTPHAKLIPVAALLLLSSVGCSSKTESEHVSAGLANDSSPLIDSDTGLSNDTSNSTIGSSEAITRDNLVPERLAGANADDTSLNDSNTAITDAALQLNSSNYEQIAKMAARAINLAELNTERDNARELLADLNKSGWAVVAGESGLPGLTMASLETIPSEYGQGDYSVTYTCNEGGMLTVELKDFDDGPFYHHRTTFDNCHLNGQTHNGSLESSGARRAPDLTFFKDYTRASSGQSITITGEHEHSYPLFGNAETNTWKNTGYSITTGDSKVSVDNINWQGKSLDSPHQNANQGFVLLPDGTIQRVVQFEYAVDLQTSFNFTPAHFAGDSINVDVNLSYQSRYFDWQGHHQSGFDLPIFPVADLGATVEVFSDYNIDTGTSQIFDSLPKDPAPQWQDGEIRITGPDLTSIVLKPDSTNFDAVLIELNDAGEPMSRLWADGFQVGLPNKILAQSN